MCASWDLLHSCSRHDVEGFTHQPDSGADARRCVAKLSRLDFGQRHVILQCAEWH